MADLEVSTASGITTLTMNRPQARNALGDEMRTMLCDALHDAGSVAHLQEVELLAGAPVVQPATETHARPGVLGQVLDPHDSVVGHR